MAGFDRIGGKVDEQTLAHILKFYGRFGDRQQQIAAYERRKARQARGVHNLTHASHQQITALQRDGLIGAQLQRPIGSPADTGLPNEGQAFGAASQKVPGMAAQMKGGPAGGRPMVDPNAALPAAPVAATGFSPLASMLAIPPRKRRSFGTYGG